jgi:hypothetical protein
MSLLRTAAAGCLLGASIYVGADVVGEYTTYQALRVQGLALAAKDEALRAQLGEPFSDGPWWNASIGFTQSGHVAAITFPLKGSRQITDVTVRAVRRPGLTNTALYNLSGGEWKLLDCNAMAPQSGGMVRPRSLMAQLPLPKVVDGKVVAGEECEECNAAAAKAKGQPAAAPVPVVQGKAAPGKGATSPGQAAPASGRAGLEEGGPSAGTEQQPRRRRFWFF